MLHMGQHHRISYRTAPRPAPKAQPKRSSSTFLQDISKIGPDARLIPLVERRLSNFPKHLVHHVVPEHTLAPFQQAVAHVAQYYQQHALHDGKKLVIFDSGCGKGRSTVALAKAHPGVLVIGIDRSLVRLSKNAHYHPSPHDEDEQDDGEEEEDVPDADQDQLPNLCLVRAELESFWLMACQQTDWVIDKHYLLYPNPNPKSKLLSNRFYANAVFPAVLALGGQMILRTSWRTYAEEMSMAIACITQRCLPAPIPSELQLFVLEEGAPPLSHFEKKFIKQGDPIYQLTADLGRRDSSGRIVFLEGATLLTTVDECKSSGPTSAVVNGCALIS